MMDEQAVIQALYRALRRARDAGLPNAVGAEADSALRLADGLEETRSAHPAATPAVVAAGGGRQVVWRVSFARRPGRDDQEVVTDVMGRAPDALSAVAGALDYMRRQPQIDGATTAIYLRRL